MGSDEETYAKQTLMTGSLSLIISRMAEKMAKSQKVLEFARFEVAEQETVADILMGMMKDPSQATGTVNPPSDDQAMANVDQNGKDLIAKLKGLSGVKFDKEYVSAEIDGHHKLLDVQDSYLSSGKNRETLDVAKLAKGMIKEHLQLLSDLQKKM
jgi:putative membrane protein